jgi:hypothetical protein
LLGMKKNDTLLWGMDTPAHEALKVLQCTFRLLTSWWCLQPTKSLWGGGDVRCDFGNKVFGDQTKVHGSSSRNTRNWLCPTPSIWCIIQPMKISRLFSNTPDKFWIVLMLPCTKIFWNERQMQHKCLTFSLSRFWTTQYSKWSHK